MDRQAHRKTYSGKVTNQKKGGKHKRKKGENKTADETKN
jgi:hypothetical protein